MTYNSKYLAGESIPFRNKFSCFLNCSFLSGNGMLSIGKYQAETLASGLI